MIATAERVRTLLFAVAALLCGFECCSPPGGPRRAGHVLTDEQLSTAVLVARTTPGPTGVYVLSVGYSIAGVPGAIAGWAAMITPAFVVIPFTFYASRRADHRRVRSATAAVIAAIALVCVVLTLWKASAAAH